jgi:hypothetical protein
MAVAAAGCTDAGRPLVILHNQCPGCQFSANASGGFYARGRIDTQAAQGYLFAPLVRNVAVGGENDAQRLALVEGADIELEIAEGFTVTGSPDLSYPVRFSGAIEPDGGLTSCLQLFTRQFMVDHLAPT